MNLDTIIKAHKGLFTFNEATGKLVTEASDLAQADISFSMLSVVKIVNPKTGNSMDFMLNEFDKDPEGEIQGFQYVPCRASKANQYGVKGLLIIND